MIHTITLKALRPDLPKVVEDIGKKWERYIVTKHGKPSVVMISVEDYESLMETLDILADPEAVKGLKKGEEELRKGKTRSWQEIKNRLEKI
ncbi:MAG: type II toxin-antitoxin system Phd/YefM family antitoxin [Candidatus Omnitrophica bacterium]|nr:type II toxin-antitoxin system Phd/YefM family antitoxin [Candidatus Omnitrophota bacterium]